MALPVLSQRDNYGRAIITNQGWTILDNGAAEGQPVDMSELVRLAYEWFADEIVLPDVLGKSMATLDSTKQALRQLNNDHDPSVRPNPLYDFKYMAVAQGASLREAYDCAMYLSELAYVDRIAVPRILTYHFGKNARIDLCSMLAESGLTNIHCLGASPWIREVEELAKLPNVASMDTSMPIYLGYMGYRIDHLEHDAYKLRPKGYFGYGRPTSLVRDIIFHNCRVFYKWADSKASEGAVRELWPERPDNEILPE